MKTILGVSLAASMFLGTSAFAGPPQLEQRWVMDGFAAPEGVAEAPDGSYLISNVSGGGSDFDGEGWISKVSADGDLIEKEWAAGLNAPKGMVVHDDVLYVADIDRVRTYDAPTGVPGRV
ncbi:MAG: ATP-binding protein, partial [Pseudomonadota bacterium]